MMNDILNAANLYADGLKNVTDRRQQWLAKQPEINAHLKEIANYLNTNAAYKPGFYVDVLHAYNEETSGTCADLPSLTFRSGDMPMLITFKNSMGERKEFTEEGFRITFNPLITGQVIVLLHPHKSELNNAEEQYATLAVIDDPKELTMEVVDQIITKGIQGAYYSSFTGIAEQTDTDENPENAPRAHNPIGFKRYETTEKVQ